MKNNDDVAPRDLCDEETNNSNNEAVYHEDPMAKTTSKTKACPSSRRGIQPTKRIYNPVTGSYYELRERTSKTGRRGQIKGSWSSKKK
jgi:hypothetical protein